MQLAIPIPAAVHTLLSAVQMRATAVGDTAPEMTPLSGAIHSDSVDSVRLSGGPKPCFHKESRSCRGTVGTFMLAV